MTEPGSLMAGKRGLIMGVANDRSIAWGIARTLAQHGAELAFTYQGEALGKRVKPLAESVGSKMVLECDVTSEASMDAVFEEEVSAMCCVCFFLLPLPPLPLPQRSVGECKPLCA